MYVNIIKTEGKQAEKEIARGGKKDRKGEEMQNEFDEIMLCLNKYTTVNSTLMYICKTPIKSI